MLSFKHDCYSLKTDFKWKKQLDTKTNEKDTLIEARNLPGTLLCMEIWRLESGICQFRCKPIPGINVVDLIGQSRADDKTRMYFAVD